MDRKLRQEFDQICTLSPEMSEEGYQDIDNVIKESHTLLETCRKQKVLPVEGRTLGSPELLILSAEAFCLRKRFDLAQKAISSFFLQDPPKDQVGICICVFETSNSCASFIVEPNLCKLSSNSVAAHH